MPRWHRSTRASDGFVRLNGQLARLLGDVEGADLAPTPQMLSAVEAAVRAVDARVREWDAHQRAERGR